MIIIASGFETLDGCLYRNNLPTLMLDSVLQHSRNRHLAYQNSILKAGTEIYVPEIQKEEKRTVSLWD